MKRVVTLFLTLAVSLPASAALKTAQVKATCKSMVLSGAVTAYTNEVVNSTYFTTCDGRNVVPQHDTLPDGLVRMSDELRPRSDQPGIYDVDYATVSESAELVEYGTMMFRLPIEDTDANGLPDFLQREGFARGEITGNAQSDWPEQLEANLLGSFERQTNATEGSFALTASRAGRSAYFSGSFSVPSIEGEVDYSAESPTQLVFRLSMSIGGATSALTGRTRCSVNGENEISLEQFILRDSQDRSRTVLPTVLHRVAGKYIAALEFNDGNPDTSWPDYANWVVEITDVSDINSNGVPDLSDPLVISDTVPPTVRIAGPANVEKVTNATVTLSGTARDNVGIGRVEFRIGTEPFATAIGTTRWSANATLAPGTNIVEVRAFDARGNESTHTRRKVVYVVYAPLIIQINGSGTVTPYDTGQKLVLGRSYSLHAVPQPGFVFSHWSGGVSGTRANIGFVMQSNLVIQANFIPNPFLPLAGGYEGLFFESGTVRPESSGTIRLSLRANGTYTARLLNRGKTNVLVGRFDLQGASSATVARGAGALSLQLQLDLSGGSEQLTGLASNSAWTANLLAYRAGFAPGQNTNFAGRYTLRLAGSGDGSLTPGGDGFATIVVDSLGKVRAGGKLADGTPFTCGTALSRNGTWPLFASLYRGKGVVLGWVRCTAPPDILDSSVTWIRPPVAGARYYAAGFSVTAPVTGSGYDNNRITNGLLNFTKALLIASGGGLPGSITNQLTLGSDSKFVTEDPRLASFKVNLINGTVSGGFLSGENRLLFEGVLLHKQNFGAGYFLGPTSSGSVRLIPAP